jgi:hypothetical protein
MNYTNDLFFSEIPDKLHPYLKVDVINGTNYYRKFIENKSGGTIEGNNFYKYDFDIQNNTPLRSSKLRHPLPVGVGEIFLGKKDLCTFVLIENNIAQIQTFNYYKTCPINNFLENGTGTRHMFLWCIICILKYFPKIKKIELGDNSKINCDGQIKYLAKYYFLKYGKQFYEYYFSFKPIFYSEKYKQLYYENLQKRKITEISIKYIKKLYKKFIQLHNNNTPNKEMIKYFTNMFEENKKMNVIKFFKKIPKKIQHKFCNFFFFITDEIFEKYFNKYIGQTYLLNISQNPKKIIKNIRIHINTIIYPK